ncbi:PTS sugar transporter subunit IIA [Salirhabdus salicampi]|uniref:PTS sugar transporter subunit IIA n=1 Tax=Salirhabdus salicampi TaxID=476102 RepID=UPI0020C3CA2F|nr:PTS sugar transporter subunit IIA [Salirhabdus salicampi]MCP8615903.1 PTS sugar transporter subunit IIA [Salirhabdus salicampi]
MLNSFISHPFVEVTDRQLQWKDAITLAASPLLKHSYIEQQYIDSIISQTKKIGPYYVIGPKVALPHSRPEDGVNQYGISFLLTKNPVSFSSEARHDVHFIIFLAAEDNSSHLSTLSRIASMLGDENNSKRLLECESKEELQKLLLQYLGKEC